MVGLLCSLKSQDADSYYALLGKMTDSDDPTLVRLGAIVVSRSDHPTDHEIAALRSAARFKEPTVVSATIQALRPLLETNPDEARRLIAEIDLGTDSNLANDLCEVLFDLNDDAPAIDLPADIISSLLTRFVSLETIQESRHHLRVFLDWVSRRDPISVAGLFLNRIRTYGDLGPHGTTKYRPVPYASFWIFPTRLAAPEARKSALRLVRDAALDPDFDITPWLSHLFVSIAGGWDEATFAVLSEWLESDDPAQILGLARLLRSADPDFVFSHEDFTARLLDAADAAGPQPLETVTRSLVSTASSRGGSGTPGEPMPHWIDLRNRAREVAARHPTGSAAQQFFASLEDYSIGIIEHDRKSWEEDELS